MEEMGNQTREIQQEQSQEIQETQEQSQQEMTQEEQEAFLKIKYNKEEIALDEEKTRELAQKGMNYDKVQERLKQLESDPRLSFVEKQAQKYGFEDIGDYLKAVEQAEEQERIRELAEKEGISSELAERLHKLETKEQQRERQAKEYEAQKAKESNYKEFLETYPDVKPEDIPQSVWQEFEKGKSLVDAYAKHENQLLKTKLSEIEKSKEIQAKNEENAQSSTGSLGKEGSNKLPFFTKEQVEKMTPDQVNKNWKAIMESQKQWFK